MPGPVGSGSSLSTLRANGVIGIGVPAAYVAPVRGSRTGIVKIPCRCSIVGIDAMLTTFCVSRKPS